MSNVEKISKKIPLLGLVTFLLILLFLTIIFNWYWTGLGNDLSHDPFPSFTRDKKEFIEYATLYIPLISFGATMFAGLAVFLVFNDWKVEHNKKIESEYYQEAVQIMKAISGNIHTMKLISDNLHLDINGYTQPHAEDYISTKKKYLENLDALQNQIIFIDLLNRNSELAQTIFPFINKARLTIQGLDCSSDTISRSPYDMLCDILIKEVTYHGNLIKDNLPKILFVLHSKIKA